MNNYILFRRNISYFFKKYLYCDILLHSLVFIHISLKIDNVHETLSMKSNKYSLFYIFWCSIDSYIAPYGWALSLDKRRLLESYNAPNFVRNLLSTLLLLPGQHQLSLNLKSPWILGLSTWLVFQKLKYFLVQDYKSP